MMKVYTPEQIKRMPGLVEVISERGYTKSGAKARSKGNLPKGITPVGTFILEKLEPQQSESGRMVTRYLLLWHIERGDAR